MGNPCRNVEISKNQKWFWTKRNRVSYILLAREKCQALKNESGLEYGEDTLTLVKSGLEYGEDTLTLVKSGVEYGEDTLTLVRKYCRNKEAVARQKNNIVFDLRCKSEGILPTALRLRAPIRTPAGRRIAEKAGRQFLNEHPQMSNSRVRKIQDDLKWTDIGFCRHLNEEDFERLQPWQTKQPVQLCFGNFVFGTGPAV